MSSRKMMVLAEQTDELRKIQFLKRLKFTHVVRMALQEYAEHHKDLVQQYNRLFGGECSEE